MLRHLFIAALSALVLAGCTASSKLQLTLGNRYKYSVSMVGPEKSKDMLYRDEQLIIQFRVDDPGIRFQAQNISPDTMRIDWAKATIGVHGSISPIRTMSTFYDTTKLQPASQLLPSLGVVRDVMLPWGNTYFDGAQWRIDDLLPTSDANSHDMRNTIVRSVGSTIEIQLPIECGSDVRQYLFSFSVDSVRRILWSDYRPASWIPPHPPVKGLRPTSQDNLTAVIIASSFMGFLRYMMTVKKVPVVE
jgi:hypothetical protein